MNCETYRDQWHARADGELPTPDEAALDAHAAACEKCRQYDAQMRAVFAGLDRLRDRPIATTHEPLAAAFLAPLRVAAAVGLFVGASWLLASLALNRPSHRPDTATTATSSVRELEPSLTLTGESSNAYLAVARPSSEPNVRIYWLYRIREPHPSDSLEQQTIN